MQLFLFRHRAKNFSNLAPWKMDSIQFNRPENWNHLMLNANSIKQKLSLWLRKLMKMRKGFTRHILTNMTTINVTKVWIYFISTHGGLLRSGLFFRFDFLWTQYATNWGKCLLICLYFDQSKSSFPIIIIYYYKGIDRPERTLWTINFQQLFRKQIDRICMVGR